MHKESIIGEKLFRDLEITQVYNSGGMGIVYVCKDTELDFEIALKTYHFNQAENAQLFSNALIVEALNWIKLGKHPNIARAYFTVLKDDIPYIFIEYIQNELHVSDLESFLDKHDFQSQEIIEFAIQVCSAMKYAARASPGLVHLDLKPANVLIGDNKIYKITDFGLSKIISLPLGGRLDSAYGGTAGYMSPEQSRGSDSVDARSDIFSLGCILYQMVTRQLPFYGGKEDTIRGHQELDPPITRELEKSVIKNIILTCLEKKPEKRYGDFDELYNELERLYFKITAKRWDDLPVKQDVIESKIENLKNKIQIDSEDFWKISYAPYLETFWYEWKA